MKKLIALMFVSALAAMSVRADLIWYEGFQYPNGNVTNESAGLWICPGGQSGSGVDMFVNNSNLEVSASSSTVAPRTSDDYRLLAITANSPYTNSSQIIYSSFMVNCTNLPNGAGTYFASFYSTAGTGGGYWGRVFAQTNTTVLANTWRLGVSGRTAGVSTVYPVDLALNTSYQVVLAWDPVTLNAVSLWVNPISSGDPSAASGDAVVPPATPINAFAFRQASSFGSFFATISNLTTATTFIEALTNTMATNAVPPTIVRIPVAGTNFVGATVELTALVNGQGQGNLTYQWKRDGGDISNPNGNANVFTISSVAVSDTGNYQLAVTTPYGLSTTSSAAFLWVTNPPVPPTITTQPPTNNPVYDHSTLVLHVIATGPPTLSYQWFQNNSLISDNAFFTGTGSDTLTISDITVANGNTGTYRCDVTNPYGTTPSSNAVVTVATPQAVTIAYLRSLVDPVTYIPTNTTHDIAYSVTGIVTPYTNSSSGDTASYFLQDATAGINIFATFASTFRPLQGDSVTYVGVLSSFSTVGTELYANTGALPYTSYTINSSGNALPAPVAIPFDVTNNLDYVNYTVAGSLVKLSGVYFGTNNGTMTTTNNYSIIVSNSAGKNFKLQFFGTDLDTQNQTFPEYASTVTGILYGGSPNFSVAVTKFSDIVAATPPPTTPVLNLATSGSTLTMTWTGASVLQASTNVAGPYTAVPGATSPFVTNGAASSVPSQFFRLFQAP